MKKTRKLIGIICLLAVLMMVFSACQPGQSVQSDGDTPSAKDTPAAKDTPTEAPKKVSLRFSWWGGDARHQATLEAIKLYMDRNPNVTIEAEYGGYGDYYQKLVTQLAGESAPDIMQVDSIWIADLYKQGEMFVDLYTMEDKMDMSGFDKTFLKNYCEVDGKLQGLPKSIATATFIYNVEFFLIRFYFVIKFFISHTIVPFFPQSQH